VRVWSVDAYVQKSSVTRVGFIKCDVEGHELRVFRGAEATLRRDGPALLFECEARFGGEDRQREVFAFLEGLGYVGWIVTPSGVRPLRTFDASLHQTGDGKHAWNNFVFTRKAQRDGAPEQPHIMHRA
jgi:hypothetical protein